MNVRLRKISTITPYENNPRSISDAAVKAVANSIERFGWQQPIVVDREGVIVVGHARYMAAQSLGIEKVPTSIMDAPEEDLRAYRLADNRTGEIAEWDIARLGSEINLLDEAVDLRDFGFLDPELKLHQIDEYSVMSGERSDPFYDDSPDAEVSKMLENKVVVQFLTDEARRPTSLLPSTTFTTL